MQLCCAAPTAAMHKPLPVRSPVPVVPRGGVIALSSSPSSRRRSLVVMRTGSDPGVPTQGSRYPTPGGGVGGSAGGSGAGGSGGGGGGGSSGGRGGALGLEPAVSFAASLRPVACC